MTFKKETLEAIKDSGHKQGDVMFIGSSDGRLRVSLEEFLKISDFEYDRGFGAQEIANDLIIYFKDKSYISRGEYDGSEWWEFNTPLGYADTDKSKKFTLLSVEQNENCSCGWESLDEINN